MEIGRASVRPKGERHPEAVRVKLVLRLATVWRLLCASHPSNRAPRRAILSWIVFPFSLVGAAVIVATVYVWRWRIRSRNRRTPLTSDLLRPPGYSVQQNLQDAMWDVATYLGIALFMPPLFVAVYVVNRAANSVSAYTGGVVFLTAGFISLGWIVKDLWKTLHRVQRLRLGFDAEAATGEELNQLARRGFWVFHDVPGERFNIDHVVVGPTGVFAVETKGRSKPIKSKEGEATAEVVYDGRSLRFPGWTETKPLEQARRNAKWLQAWLSSAVGESVYVDSVLSLPGWFVTRTVRNGLAVLNPRNAEYFFCKPRGVALTDTMIQRIAHQLEQRCRDVGPSAYVQAEKKAA
ncbi:MAG: nuclease-related domain-containing protein [Burkholderiales bacterium]